MTTPAQTDNPDVRRGLWHAAVVVACFVVASGGFYLYLHNRGIFDVAEAWVLLMVLAVLIAMSTKPKRRRR